jgi:hypothetical protein
VEERVTEAEEAIENIFGTLLKCRCEDVRNHVHPQNLKEYLYPHFTSEQIEEALESLIEKKRLGFGPGPFYWASDEWKKTPEFEAEYKEWAAEKAQEEAEGRVYYEEVNGVKYRKVRPKE